ncbi:MAG: hypothetical protein AABX33_07535 [Nanoarchaeota archaeon]
MSFLLEKTETKRENIYKINPKLWYGTGLPLFVFVIIAAIFNKTSKIWMVAVLSVYVWLVIVAIGCFPIWWAYLSGKETITRERKGWLMSNTIWKIKK